MREATLTDIERLGAFEDAERTFQMTEEAKVGGGPYRLREYVSQQHVLLEANPRYFRAGYPRIPEVVFRVRKYHHAGVIVASPDAARVEQLVSEYTRRFYEDFHAFAPVPDRPTD